MASMTIEFLRAHDLPGRRDSVQHFEAGNRTGVDQGVGAALCAAGIALDVNGKLDASALTAAPADVHGTSFGDGDGDGDEVDVNEDGGEDR